MMLPLVDLRLIIINIAVKARVIGTAICIDRRVMKDSCHDEPDINKCTAPPQRWLAGQI